MEFLIQKKGLWEDEALQLLDDVFLAAGEGMQTK
jgi:hypothetical protein